MRALLLGVDASIWSQVSAIVFGSIFVILAVWVYLPMRRAEYQRAEKLPLED